MNIKNDINITVRTTALLATFAINLACLHSADGADYYIHPDNGSDDSAGTKESPWKTLGHAMSPDSPIGPGDTVYLRGGNYHEFGIWIKKSGSEGQPIVIRNHPGEEPVIYGTDPAFAKVPNKEWEIIDKERNVYKSVKQWERMPLAAMYQTGSPARWYGLIDYRDRPSTPENDNENLYKDNEFFSHTPPIGYYGGPGYYWNAEDKHIYIRLTHPRPDITDRPMDLAHSLNPNEVAIQMPMAPDGMRINCLNFQDAHYIDMIGLRFGVPGGSVVTYPGSSINIWTGSNLNFKDLTVENTSVAIFVRSVTNMTVDNLLKIGCLPPYLAWNDTKGGACVNVSLSQSDGVALSSSCINVEVKNSRFIDCFDGIRTNSQPDYPSHGLKFHHNKFEGIRDDAISSSTGTWDVEIHDNEFINVSKAISRVGGGVHTDHPTGNVFIHHNVIEIGETFQSRRRSDTEPALYTNHVPFGTHSIGNPEEGDTAQPWKLYHNTVSASGPIPGDNGMGFDYAGVQKVYEAPYNLKEAHEVYNNIFMLKGDWFFIRNARLDSGQEVYDGNIYWKVNTGGEMPFSNPIYNRAATPFHKSFATLEEFKSHEWYPLTQAYYPPGWENSGVEADPEVDGDFRPVAGGLASTPGVDLSKKGWPGATRIRNRGALAPIGQ